MWSQYKGKLNAIYKVIGFIQNCDFFRNFEEKETKMSCWQLY